MSSDVVIKSCAVCKGPQAVKISLRFVRTWQWLVEWRGRSVTARSALFFGSSGLRA
jgi:hypothetical protein